MSAAVVTDAISDLESGKSSHTSAGKNEKRHTVAINPMVSTISAVEVDNSEGETDEEDPDNEETAVYYNLPPLVRTSESRKSISIKSTEFLHFLKVVDVICMNVGSLMFVVGSVYFYPSYAGDCGIFNNCDNVGAILFIAGSALFLVASLILFVLSGGSTFQDMALTYNGLLYVFANTLFLIGSILFVPSLTSVITVIPGITLFIVGSVIFVLAPLYNIYRAIDLRAKRLITQKHMKITIGMALFYIIGSLAFVIGSVYFLPSLYQNFSVTFFVWGSVCFQCSSLLVPIKYGWIFISQETSRLSVRLSKRLSHTSATGTPSHDSHDSHNSDGSRTSGGFSSRPTINTGW